MAYSARGALREIGSSYGDLVTQLKDSGEVVERTTHQPYGALETDYRPDRWGAAREAFKAGCCDDRDAPARNVARHSAGRHGAESKAALEGMLFELTGKGFSANHDVKLW